VGLVIVKRPPRRPAPVMPSGEVVLDPPPEIPNATGKGWGRLMTIMPMAAGGGAMALMMGAGRGSAGPLTYVAGGMYGLSMLGMIAAQLSGQGGQTKKDMIEARRQYMRRLSQLRAQVRQTIARQRDAIHYRHPEPDALWSTVSSGRLWERRRGDVDFGVVRIGLGPQEIATPLVPPQTRPVDELEPLCAVALRKFVTTYSVVPDLPVAIALREFSHVYLRGADEPVRGLVRAMLAQLAVFHAPDDLLIGVCVSDARRPQWEWAKWLPQALHPAKTDGLGPVRLFAPSVTALEAMLDDVLLNRPRFGPSGPAPGGPHVVVLIDGGATAGSDHLMTDAGLAGVTLVDLSNPPPRLLDDASVVLDVTAQGLISGITMEGSTEVGRADELPGAASEIIARELAPLRLSAASYAGDAPVTQDLGLADLLGLEDPADFDLSAMWASRPNRDRLRVPIGVSTDARPVELDLKESAQEGMGPHGLLVGATGSGKSELLRTLVLALAVTHNSEILNFVLVDFKGGATFAKLDRLPHTSAVITNLENELPLVDRMLGAISGELTRRQELLRATKYDNQRDYERARSSGVPLQPLPSLLLIVDEFSELLTARPDFIDMFVQIGRVGRSLGVHLLLASQRLEEGRLRGLETHLSYRIGLRTFSSMDSRAVLGVGDAYELPRSPGHGYLKSGTEAMIRFRAAYVSGVYRSLAARQVIAARQVNPVRNYTTHYVAPPVTDQKSESEIEPDESIGADTLLDVLVRRLEGQGPPPHQVWLPPLAEPSTLDQMLPPPVHSREHGLTVGDAAVRGSLHGVVGIVDRPFEQRRDLMWLDLAGAGGNLVVIGGPQSGKSNLLRTLIASLALTHTPREVQAYCLDFGGGALTAMRDLPHVGSVATRRDVNRVRRTVAELSALLRQREERFATHGIDGIATYRRQQRAGQHTDDPYGDVFFVVDGWGTLRTEFEDLEPQVSELANRGLGFGIHVVAASNRWMDIRPATRDLFGTKVELRLGEPADSMINRRAAVNVPEQTPGRGLTPDGYHFLAGLPRLDGRQRVDDLADGVAEMVKLVRVAWPYAAAPPVRLLPDELAYDTLISASTADQRLPIGIAESDLQPVYLDLEAEPHLLLFGDVECGKSSFLRGLARTIVARRSSQQARIIMVDYRRSMLGCVSGDHLIGYGTSAETTKDLISQVVTVMQKRLPGPDVTPEQLRSRSWWRGPELYLLIDDYDLVAGAGSNPVAPLLDFLAQGRDIGLHVIVTRRVGGASRAMFDPVVARIRELASPGILMSGPREEGPIFGSLKPQFLPAGRGFLVTRRDGARLVQLAWVPPAD
jgi:DNA segregation ATPase FtsK/SpoIIIE, S-DNA-T family